MNPIIVLMGVSGCGKSTVGKLLAVRSGGAFIEGDDFHPAANVAKMTAGLPLDDDDRAEWLVALSREIQQADQRPHFLSCSALKASYRQLLELASPERLRFVYLYGSQELLAQRLADRTGHYMPESLLQSQLKTLEEPENALRLDISEPPEALTAEILATFLPGHQSSEV